MSAPAIVAELARVKVLFQRRAIVAVLGCPVQDTRPQQDQREAHCGSEGLSRGVDIHTDFSLTKPERDHG